MGRLLCTEDVDNNLNSIHSGCLFRIFRRKHAGLVKHTKGNKRSIKPRRSLERTYSIHHLETDEWVDPIVFFPENVDSEDLSQKDSETCVGSEEIDQDDTKHKINEDLFKSILRNDSGISVTRSKFTKSGSFPSVSVSKNLRPTKLKHKLNEFYAVSKIEKKLDNLAPKLEFIKSGSLDKQGGKKLDAEISNGNFMRIRRIRSLNEFENRYSQFFENGNTKEAVLRSFRSLKLRKEYDKQFLERTLVSVSSSTEKDADVDATESNEFLNGAINIIDISLRNENSSTTEEVNHEKTQEINRLNQVLVPECCLQEENYQGIKLLCNAGEDTENEIKSVNNNIHTESLNENNHNAEYFNYVKKILEQSGFMKYGFQQTWHSTNTPLDPLIFQEIESQYPHDPQRFEEELVQLSNHLLRFDLVNEALYNIHEKSSLYYPNPLSYTCHLNGKVLLQEVWKSVNRLLNVNPEMDNYLEAIMARDLRVGDCWRSLKMDFECISLEFEDMIFNELLEEIFSS